MKVLVFGKNGQVGYKICQALKRENVDFISVNSSEVDFNDDALISSTIAEYCPDIVINAVAYTAVDKAESKQELAKQVNGVAPKVIANACEQLGAVFIHISTDYVFNGEKEEPYIESDSTGPMSIYGLTKLKGEQAVQRSCSKHIIIRTSWVFGEHGHNFVKTMLKLADKTELRIVDDQIGSPTYAGDIADFVIRIIKQLKEDGKDVWGIYHYSGDRYLSWYEFACEIFAIASSQQLITQVPQLKPITTAEYPTPAKRPKFSKLNCEKAKRFGELQNDWRSGVSFVIESMK